MQEHRQCTATSKRSGKRCRNPPMDGRAVCRMHGGKSPRGLAHPSTTHGGYSKDLVARSMRDHQTNRLHPELLELSEDAALSQTLIQEALRSSQLPEYWAELRALYEKVCRLYIDGLVFLGEQPSAQELAELLMRPEGGELGRALGELGEQIAKGKDRFSIDLPTMVDVARLIEVRRRVVKTENARFTDQGLMWPIPRVQAYVGQLITCVRQYVDNATMARIADDFRARAGGSPPSDNGADAARDGSIDAETIPSDGPDSVDTD